MGCRLAHRPGHRDVRGNGADVGYDHGLEVKRYQREQEKIARWLKEKAYLG
jgi:hypothetical protein